MTPYSLRPELFGAWTASKSGNTIDSLEPISEKTKHTYVFRDDGVFELKTPSRIDPTERDHTWQVIGNDLVITIAVAPMPEYGLDDWSSEDIFYEIASISDGELVLDSRPSGGEVVTVYHRDS